MYFGGKKIVASTLTLSPNVRIKSIFFNENIYFWPQIQKTHDI